MKAKRSILLIDDDCDTGEFVCTAARAKGWECTATTDAGSFIENLTADTTLIFLDLLMPHVDGVELLRLLGQLKCEAGIVLMSGVGKRVMETADQMAQVLGLFVVGHLEKPFQLSNLEEMLERQNRPETARVFTQKSKMILSEAESRSAIKREEFVLHYQPQIDIATSSVVGVEALVRWLHPQRGLIHPDIFIAHMEVLGLIDQLGQIVAKRALNDVGRFAGDDGIAPMLSINVSARSLHNLRFPDDLEALAKSFGVPADKITIEITESGLISELAKTLDVLTRLRMKEVRLSIDDFGTGYSMMRQLRHIPATELKIDRAFVQRMGQSYADRVMVQKTIEIGHDLGMRVIAEGVETAEQLQFLRINGCDLAQGYLFSRPLDPEALVSWLRNYRSTHPGHRVGFEEIL